RLGGNAFIYGLVSAIYPACALASAPVLGRWSDRYGRKRVLLLCEAGTVLGWVVLAVALSLPANPLANVAWRLTGPFTVTLPLLLVFLARATDGMTAGNSSITAAYVADVTPPEKRNSSFGAMGVSSNLGFVVGPAIAGALGSTRLGDRLPVYATLGVSLAAAAMIAWYLPESHERTSTAVPHAHHRRWGALGEALDIPHVGRMLVLYFASYLAFNFYYSAFPVHAIQNLGFGITASGAYFAILSVLMVAVQGLVLPWASRRWTDIQLMVAGSLMLCANFLLLLTTNLAAVGASVALFALGNGVMWPSAVALLSKVAGEEEQGLVQGVASSAGNLASIAGLIAGGLVFETLGAWTFMLAAALITVAGAVALPLRGLPR
ncbi:MAG TPA: MFS transporter, partial [Myxococcaceae bacterium]|nr:MFS transporter [Myxococcaceae bacterium]